MPGSLCSGKLADEPKEATLKNSKAYCEGYLARTQAVTPTNPHAADSEAYNAFENGVQAKADDDPPGCCAPCGDAYVAP